jgi:pheromone shutdown protein TraB
MVEKLKNRKLVRRFVQVMKQAYPEVVNVMLTERDVVMAANLRRCPGKVVVGVVGLAHLDGIEKHFKPIMALPQVSPILCREWCVRAVVMCTSILTRARNSRNSRSAPNQKKYIV